MNQQKPPQRGGKRAVAASLSDSRRQVMRLLLLGIAGAAIALIPFIARAEETVVASAMPVPPVIAAQPAAPESLPLPPGDIITPDEAAAADPRTVQEVIKAQLAAIRARDADLAYSFMSHDFHEENHDALTFLSDMRFTQRGIYNHDEYTFLDSQSTDDINLQKVRMNDHYGKPVTVIYRMERQDDGSWLIDSFTILKIDAQPI